MTLEAVLRFDDMDVFLLNPFPSGNNQGNLATAQSSASSSRSTVGRRSSLPSQQPFMTLAKLWLWELRRGSLEGSPKRNKPTEQPARSCDGAEPPEVPWHLCFFCSLFACLFLTAGSASKLQTERSESDHFKSGCCLGDL